VAVSDALAEITPSVASEDAASYLKKFETMGGIIEEFLEGSEVRSPSCQIRIDPKGRVILISTHDQLLGGRTNQVYMGCRFPAADEYRRQIQDAAIRVGRVLAAKGVVSRLGVDFVVRRAAPEAWEVFALEINLRIGGTTHPFLALEFLTGGRLDPESGEFRSPNGLTKVYRSTDNLRSDSYRGLLPDDLLEITTMNHLHYSQSTETGVLFHMIGAVSQFGKVGLTVIGNRHDQVDSIYERVIAILDRETAYGRAPVPGAVETEPEAHPSAGRREYRDTIVVPTIWREGT